MNFNFTRNKSIGQQMVTGILCGIACLFVISLYSCNKDSTTATNSSVALVAGSPDMPPVDVYIDRALASSNLVYGSYISYSSVTSGEVIIGYDYTGTTTHLTGDTLNLVSGKSYSLFSSDLVAKHQFLLVPDTIVAPATGKASIRLVNMSPDAPAVDLVVGGKVLISNKSYKQASPFTAIGTTDNDTLRIVQTGTNNVLGVVNALSVEPDVVYTIWLNGFASGLNGYSLHANIMRNAVF